MGGKSLHGPKIARNEGLSNRLTKRAKREIMDFEHSMDHVSWSSGFWSTKSTSLGLGSKHSLKIPKTLTLLHQYVQLG
jgi:hypothetical protein